MVFSNELEAYYKYAAYAIGKGFGVRKAQMVKKRNIRDMKLNVTVLLIKFKVDNGIYEVIESVSKHNHPFIPEDQKHLIICGRMISNTCKSVLVDMTKVGIGGTTTYKFLANEAGGSQNLGFNLHDCQNYLQTKRSEVVSGGDCQNLLNHFHCMQIQNPMFSYVVQVDQDGRLTNLF
ncbi:hypothetical protein EUGRSUZ_I00733 [Eucalyptus grandis]|uniref:Uncharacterized protein n=2 Tax=Eucalyptus grandis TaxID=71139 RepID=A0ACC3JD50_EUCGR|nr:hypothetical protein EUGRSUZ_I00733 [Eucalyptus grandis]